MTIVEICLYSMKLTYSVALAYFVFVAGGPVWSIIFRREPHSVKAYIIQLISTTKIVKVSYVFIKFIYTQELLLDSWNYILKVLWKFPDILLKNIFFLHLPSFTSVEKYISVDEKNLLSNVLMDICGKQIKYWGWFFLWKESC
jgi:hypothetical protein